MQKSLGRKGLVLGIILLFIGASFASIVKPMDAVESSLQVGENNNGNVRVNQGEQHSISENSLIIEQIEYLDNDRGEYWVPHQVIVGFLKDLSRNERINLIQNYNGRYLDINDKLDVMLVEIETDEITFIDNIKNERGVRYVERNGLYHLFHIPNDPEWINQWGPQAIQCPQGWDIQKGHLGVSIAIVDTGIDYSHDDLTNYISGGYDYVDNDNNPYPDGPGQYADHGTHCAGIAAATMDNHIGIAGVSQVSFIAERVLDSTGWGSWFDIAAGITHATDFGVDIISMSIGGYSYSSTVENACQYAWDNDIVLIGAADNDNQGTIAYPAKFNTVICVGAIDQNDERCDYPGWWGSNWGPEMELVAPGHMIQSTVMDDDYDSYDGTSMATPHVAGVAALIKSHQSILSNSEIRDIMVESADDLGPNGWDVEYGHGKVNAYAALTHIINHEPNEPSNPDPSNGATDVFVGTDLCWQGGDPDGDQVYYDIYFEAGDSTPDELIAHLHPQSCYEYPGNLEFNTDYYWQIKAIDEHGATWWGSIWHFTTENIPGDFDLHDPIYINGNSDFTYANGVISGAGTINNPYIIEGWEIDGTSSRSDGIVIENTNVYFIIRDCYVHHFTNGIYFKSVSNGGVEDSILRYNNIGIYLKPSCSNNFISDNVIINRIIINIRCKFINKNSCKSICNCKSTNTYIA